MVCDDFKIVKYSQSRRRKDDFKLVRHFLKEKNDLLQLFQPFGVITKLVMLRAKNQALLQMQDIPSAVNALQFYANVQPSIRGRNVYVQFSSHQELTTMDQNQAREDEAFRLLSSINLVKVLLLPEVHFRDFTNPNLPTEQKGRTSQMANAAAIAAAFGGGLPPGITGTNERCTILVANLNPDRIDEDKLFNLFSIYGNIVRIKLLRNKPDHALIQMGDGFQAELAVHFLKGAMLFGKRLEVNYSKHPNITQGADTHEYANSNLNRFNRNAAKNYRYCCSPTKMIHLSTLPQDITEEEIVILLEEHGTIVNCKVFEMNGKKQALVQFETEEQATEALVCKHASPLSGAVVRISFSQLQNI
ncbi:hypothetical protein Fmac_016154 [Flemingia macrophylla]|uniref:RRM domain-containing protein n=1 Tax=Flemingia macrophylla TaxID=520843 RepID=A0ABD1MGM3_9FABA